MMILTSVLAALMSVEMLSLTVEIGIRCRRCGKVLHFKGAGPSIFFCSFLFFSFMASERQNTLVVSN